MMLGPAVNPEVVIAIVASEVPNTMRMLPAVGVAHPSPDASDSDATAPAEPFARRWTTATAMSAQVERDAVEVRAGRVRAVRRGRVRQLGRGHCPAAGRD